MTTVALIVAAGSGSRTGLDFPKQYLMLDGKTVLERSILAFKNHADIDAVQVVINPDDQALYDTAAGHLDILPVIAGGESRQQLCQGLSWSRLDGVEQGCASVWKIRFAN